MLDTDDDIDKKIRHALTDDRNDFAALETRPAVRNLVDMYRLLGGPMPELQELQESQSAYVMQPFKAKLAAMLKDLVAPIRESYAAAADATVLQVLEQSEVAANDIARATYELVRSRVY